MLNAFSIDVEDWFHILDLRPSPPLSSWAGLESRVERNTERLLQLLDDANAHSTCFMLGWIVEQYPELSQRIVDAGHEIASHGYAHELVYEIGEERFRADLERARGLIEDTLQCKAKGYRAPGFSITEATPWALDILAEQDFRYDSSLFPAQRGHGGHRHADRLPHTLHTAGGHRLVEFPISITQYFRRSFAYCGGGYLRFFPYPFIKRQIQKANARGEPVVVYIHPRDLDPDQPRMAMPRHRAFKSYVGLGTAADKVRRLLQDFQFGTLSEVLTQQGFSIEAPTA